MVQQIRGSQFIVTYGPGSIIEGIEGPRIIPRPDIALFQKNSSLSPNNFAISDQRMSKGLLQDSGIYRLPSNAELGQQEYVPIYHTKAFPIWRLCLNINNHAGSFYILHQSFVCPVCARFKDSPHFGNRGSEPIRFVKACSAGHMDEVNWSYLSHGDDKSCANNKIFNWYGGGGSLSKVIIECPNCKKRSITLGRAYGVDWPCSGRYPEREGLHEFPVYTHDCSHKARIVQRQASNLRIPELKTLFAVYPLYTKLHEHLQSKPIYYNLLGRVPSSEVEFRQLLNALEGKGAIKKNVITEIFESPWKEICTAIDDVRRDIPESYHELIRQEFDSLNEGSLKGIPPIRGPAPKSPVLIEINPKLVARYRGPKGNLFRVTPVLTLTTVTVQTGYRREVYTKSLPARDLGELVDVSFPDPIETDKKWYPGVQYLGEGLFIKLENQNTPITSSKSVNAWMNAFKDNSSYPEHVFRDCLFKEELHPSFVWWHTLSHLLIREIASEAGYSSSAIRERIYLENTEKECVGGGILLYATQPGSEGTLGGLTALVPHFQDMIDKVFDQLQACSSDPLCLEHTFKLGDYNGSACYGCLLLSETSCDHRNMWLDRNVILENLP